MKTIIKVPYLMFLKTFLKLNNLFAKYSHLFSYTLAYMRILSLKNAQMI